MSDMTGEQVMSALLDMDRAELERMAWDTVLSMELTEAERASMLDRLGFDVRELPDMDTMSDDNIRVMLFLFGLLASGSLMFNEAATLLREAGERGPMLEGASTGLVMGQGIAPNLLCLLRDVTALIVRLGLQNPGLIGLELCSDETGLLQEVIAAGQVMAIATADAKEMAEQLGDTFADMESGVRESAQPNPFGGKRTPAEA